jgi:hypothetical protein
MIIRRNKMKDHGLKLLNCFLGIEESMYPKHRLDEAKKRSETVRKFVEEFGCNHVTVNNYTNMMQFSSSITIDRFKSEKYMNGDINIDLGSELHELFAKRIRTEYPKEPPFLTKYIKEVFDFKSWQWVEYKEPEPSNNTENDDEEN